MTGYVVTRWYRAPEVIFNWMHYSQTGSNFPFFEDNFILISLTILQNSKVLFFFFCLQFYLPTSPTVDMWSAACILAEMLTDKVLFPGHDSILTHAAHYVMTIHVGLER